MIDTGRLILRPHRLDDLEEAQALLADQEVLRFIGAKPLTREDVWQRLLRYAGHWSLLGYGLFAVVEKASGRLVGEAGLADFHRGLGSSFDPYPEAAWVIARAAQGRGYAYEAVAAAHDWLVASRRSTRTVCIIDPLNAPSRKLADKLGYRAFGEAPYRNASVTMFERLTNA